MDAPSLASEKPVLTLRTHPKVLFVPVLIQVALLAAHYLLFRIFPLVGDATVDQWLKLGFHGVVVLAELVYCIVPILRWWTSSFELTTHRVFTHEGIVARTHKEIAIPRISQVSVERGILDRIFGAGTIKLYDASNTLGLEFKDVPQVLKVKETLDRKKGLS